jgi:hypothetical protein
MACFEDKPSYCKEYFKEKYIEVEKNCPLNFPGPDLCDGDISRVVAGKKDERGCTISYKCKEESQEGENSILGVAKKEHPSVKIKNGQVVSSPLKIEGNSEGAWFGFEGQLGTVSLVDNDGKVLGLAVLNILGD